jgi:hypothetical protein
LTTPGSRFSVCVNPELQDWLFTMRDDRQSVGFLPQVRTG